MQNLKNNKFIFVTGGVYSSLGKGIIASSIARILKDLGFKVSLKKLDPYLNIDAVNLSPLQHGESFITIDGSLTDLDLGTYQRFIEDSPTQSSSITSGKIFYEILKKERENQFEGKTVQIVPHVTNAIIEHIKGNHDSEIVIIEIGGTIGDIESLSFIEAISQFKNKYGNKNVLSIHCSPLIYIENVNELKTKPTQHSVKLLRSLGVNPDILLLRTHKQLDDETISKIAWSCGIDEHNIFAAYDVDSVYLMPNILFDQGIHNSILKQFEKTPTNNDINEWKKLTTKIIKNKQKQTSITIVGEYIELPDAYKSIIESIKLSSHYLETKTEINFVDLRLINEMNYEDLLKESKAVVIPQISYNKDILQKAMLVAKYVREKDIPSLFIASATAASLNEYLQNKLNINLLQINDEKNNWVCTKDLFSQVKLKTFEKLTFYQNNMYDQFFKSFFCEYFNDLEHDYATNNDYNFNARYLIDFEINEEYFDLHLKNHFTKLAHYNNKTRLISLNENKYNVSCLFFPEYNTTAIHPEIIFLTLIAKTFK